MAQYFSNFAYDYNYKTSLVFELFFSVVDLVIIYFSWAPIASYYYHKEAEAEKVEGKDAPVITDDENSGGIPPTEVVEYGCEDENGNPCT